MVLTVIFKKKSQHESKNTEKRREKEKEKKIRNNERKQRDRMSGMHQYVDPFSPSMSPALYQRQRILLGTSHLGSFSSKWLISTARFSLRDYSRWGERFPSWSWSCDIAGHSRLIFLYLFFFLKLMSYLLISTIFFTRLFLSLVILIGDYLFTLSKGKSIFFYYYDYYHVCLPSLIQSNSTCQRHVLGKRGIVCAQTGPKWVAVGLVSTP